jgi:hypothetical protein
LYPKTLGKRKIAGIFYLFSLQKVNKLLNHVKLQKKLLLVLNFIASINPEAGKQPGNFSLKAANSTQKRQNQA